MQARVGVARVLVCGGDPSVLREAASALVAAGFEVAELREGNGSADLRVAPHVAVVDISSQPERGYEFCRQMREDGVPVLALTEVDADNDVDDGREAGADDYQIKPVNLAELVARVRVLLRRHAHPSKEQVLRIRDLIIDQERLQVVKEGRAVNLTPTQFRLLTCLVRNAGRVMTSRELLRGAQGYDVDEQEAQEIVKVHVNRLRQKIEPDAGAPTYIVNVRGFGYMLERRSQRG